MNIIKRGVPPAKTIWRGTCNHCGTVAEAEQGELRAVRENQQDGAYAWEKCPVCEDKDAIGKGHMLFSPVKKA